MKKCVLTRVFHETDAKGREHIGKQYIQEFERGCLSGYVRILTTSKKENAYHFNSEKEANSLFNSNLSELNQPFSIEMV